MRVYTVLGDRVELGMLAQQRAGKPVVLFGNYGQPGSRQVAVKVAKGLPHPRILRADFVENEPCVITLCPEDDPLDTSALVAVRVHPGEGGSLTWGEGGEVLVSGVRADGPGRCWDERLYLLHDDDKLIIARSGERLVGPSAFVEVRNERGELVRVK